MPARYAPTCRSDRGPTFRVSVTARLLIIGQAPGTKVHATGIPWNDPSGDRLRGWLGLDRATFYDVARIAIVPAGLCYPGRLPGGGDAPPKPVCAPTWHPRLLPLLPEIGLTLLVGSYAQVASAWPRRGGRAGAPVRRAAAAVFSAAPSVLANHRLGAAQSLVRGGGAAGAAGGGGGGAGADGGGAAP